MALPAGLTVPARPPAPHPADTATPTLSRRHAAGAPSARGLLLTLLGEFVLTGDETAWTSAVLATFGGLGIEEKTTRQALMRTAAAGWLDAEKLGRRTRWRLTGAARRMLTDGAARIYSFTGPDPDWDGRWLLISARIPESDRRARHVLRTRLSWAGFGSLGPALWVSPHPDREAEAIRVLREAGIADDAHVFIARRSGLGDERTMVATAWDLTAIEDQYGQFIEEFGPELPEPSHPEPGHSESEPAQSPACRGRRTPWAGRSSSCTPGGGSRPWIPRCRGNCCRPGGAGWRRPGCSGSGTSSGPPPPASSGGASTTSAEG